MHETNGELESLFPAFQQVQAEEASSAGGFVTGEQRSHVQCRENEQPSLSCLTQSGNVCSEPFLEHKKVEGPGGGRDFLSIAVFMMQVRLNIVIFEKLSHTALQLVWRCLFLLSELPGPTLITLHLLTYLLG